MRSGTVAGMTGRFPRRRRQWRTVRRGGGGEGAEKGGCRVPGLVTPNTTRRRRRGRGVSHRGAPGPAGRRPPHAPHSDSSDATAADGDGGGVDGGRCGAGQWVAAAEGSAGGPSRRARRRPVHAAKCAARERRAAGARAVALCGHTPPSPPAHGRGETAPPSAPPGQHGVATATIS